MTDPRYDTTDGDYDVECECAKDLIRANDVLARLERWVSSAGPGDKMPRPIWDELVASFRALYGDDGDRILREMGWRVD